MSSFFTPGCPLIWDTTLFTMTWDAVVLSDRGRRLGGTVEARDRIRLDVYWGLIANRSVPLNTDPARRILTVLSVAGRVPPVRGRTIRCRVYRRVEDLRAYHVESLRQLRAELSRS